MIMAAVLVILGILLFLFPTLLSMVFAALLIIVGVNLGLRRAPPLRKTKLVGIIFSN